MKYVLISVTVRRCKRMSIGKATLRPRHCLRYSALRIVESRPATGWQSKVTDAYVKAGIIEEVKTLAGLNTLQKNKNKMMSGPREFGESPSDGKA